MTAAAGAAKKKFFTELPRIHVLTRSKEERSEVTVYVKGTAALPLFLH